MVSFTVRGSEMGRIDKITTLLSRIFSIPGVTTQTHLVYGTTFSLAIIHLALPFIPLILSFAKSIDDAYPWIHVSNAINEISMGIMSVQHGNWFGLYAAACHGLTEFWLRKQNFGEDIPTEMVHNLGMLLYLFLAYKALCVRTCNLLRNGKKGCH